MIKSRDGSELINDQRSRRGSPRKFDERWLKKKVKLPGERVVLPPRQPYFSGTSSSVTQTAETALVISQFVLL